MLDFQNYYILSGLVIQAFSILRKGISMEQVGKFRKREKPFTQISNHLLRDPKVSLKAKGLYSLISSYLNLIDFTLYKGTLRANCQEGRDAFDKAWNELKDAGYLKQYKVKTDKGRFEYEYELLDEPEIEAEEELKERKANLTYIEDDKDKSTPQDNSGELACDNSTYGFSVPGNPVHGDPVDRSSVAIKNTKEKNIVKKNKHLLSTNNNSDSLKDSEKYLESSNNRLETSKKRLTGSSVVGRKVISQKDISSFFDKNEDKIKSLLADDMLRETFLDSCLKLKELLPCLPKDVINGFNDLSQEEAWSLLMFAWKTFKPDKDDSNKTYVGNEEGYIIGYLRNKIRTIPRSCRKA